MLTFHKILAGCEAGDAADWRAFVTDYTPLIESLTRVYLPGAGRSERLWKDALAGLAADDFKLLKSFEHQSEREFLLDLRAFYLGKSQASLDPALDSKDVPPPTSSSVGETLKSAPLVHQEVIFLKLAGYSSATLEKIFRLTPGVAQTSLARLGEAYLHSDQADGGASPAAWLKMLSELWAGKTENCPPARLFIRIQEGQIGWQEKDPAEKHVSECLPCLERWTALRELAYWRWTADPLAAAQADELTSALPLNKTAAAAKQASAFRRLFGAK